MKKRPLCMICMLLIIIQVLILVTGEQKSSPVADFIKGNTRENLKITGQVYKKELHSDYQILYLKDAKVSHQNQTLSQLNIVLYDETFYKTALGNKISAEGKYYPFSEPRNPGNFDQKFYYEKQGIVMAVWGNHITKISGEVWKLREGMAVFREKWHALLCDILGEKNGGMLSAMMLGERKELDADWKELYQINGIGHLLAISSLHISFIGNSLYQILRKSGVSYGKSGLIGIGFLTAYAVMAGLGVSTVRAWIMFLIKLGADMCGRVYDMGISLSVAAAVIIIWRPLYLCDAGFLLSFGALLAILLLYPFLGKMFPVKSKWADGLLASLSIQIFLFPITLYFFFEIPLYSVLLNLIVIPLMSYLLGIGFVGSLLYRIMPAIGIWVLKSSKFIFSVYDRLCMGAIRLPGARIVIGKPKLWQVFLCYCLLMTVVYIAGKQSEKIGKWKRCGIILLLACVMIVAVPYQKGNGKVQITMMDVGQGDGIFIKGPTGTTYFIDGGSSDVKNIGKYRIEPFLKSQGAGRIDYVFISHGDADHMNGIEEMLERQQVGIQIQTLVLPEKKVWDDSMRELAEKAFHYGTKVSTIEEKERVKEENLRITCLLPQENCKMEPGNAASMVLYLQYGKFDMLLTGDLEGEGEKRISNVRFSDTVDVLKVAHHGSKNSTGEEMLEHIYPKVGLISAGIGNRYGHPNKETIERLQKYGVEIYNTQKCGAVRIETDGKAMKIDEYVR